MTEELKRKLRLPETTQLVQTSSKWLGLRKGKDSDEIAYDVINEEGQQTHTLDVTATTSAYPPFGTTYHCRLYDMDGKLVHEAF